MRLTIAQPRPALALPSTVRAGRLIAPTAARAALLPTHTTAAGLRTLAGGRARAARRSTVVTRAEISYIMIKPDGVQRCLVGDIISRFERKGFQLTAMKLFTPPRSLAEEHYKDLASKPFFKDLVDYIVSGPVVAMVWQGDGVVLSARKLIGATNPLAAEPGTIRGDFAVATGRNVVHGSDSPDNGEREAKLWFGGDGDRVAWMRAVEPWLVE